MRAAEVTWPLRMGALRSARIRTRLPARSTWSMVFMRLLPLSDLLVSVRRPGPTPCSLVCHQHSGVEHAVGKAPLVVVPGKNLDHAAGDLGQGGIKNGRTRIVIEVAGDQRLGVVAQNILETAFTGL